MPIDVSKLISSTSASPLDNPKSTAAALQSLKETLDKQQADINSAGASVLMAQGMGLRAEAEARQAAIETRDELVRQNRILEQLLKESRAEAKSWKGAAVAFFIALISVVMAWLLSAVDAAQVLSTLFHH